MPGFDTQVLESAFSWLPELSKARDARERRDWTNLWRELLAVVLRVVGSEEADQNEELSGTPCAYDRWVFKEIAQLIPQMSFDEQPDQLWRPILELGPRRSGPMNNGKRMRPICTPRTGAGTI
jgi:hypothetical protein